MTVSVKYEVSSEFVLFWYTCVAHKMINFQNLILTAEFPELKVSPLLSYKELYQPICFTG